MEATKLLKKQHEEVANLFELVEQAATPEEQGRRFLELATILVAHDAMEREMLYPRCADKLGMIDILAESMVEHGVIEFGLYGALGAMSEDGFEARCTVLKELVEHHVEEEEDQLFKLMKEGFEPAELEELGSQLELKFNEALKKDIHRALANNLSAVLAGAVNPPPPKKLPKKPPATTQPRSR